MTCVQMTCVQMTCVQMTCVQMTSVQMTCVQMTCVQMTSVQMTSVQMTCVQMTCVQMTSVQMTCVQMTCVQMTCVKRLTWQHRCDRGSGSHWTVSVASVVVVVVTHPAVELFATIDDRYFAVVAPHTWNKLPEETAVAFSFQATFKNLQSTARWRHPLLVVVTWDLPTVASSSFHARGQVTATVVLPFMVSPCEILCHATCGQLTYPWPHSEIDW